MANIDKQALAYALRLLASRRYTKYQLREKLRGRNHNDDTCDAVLQYCEEQKYLNDYEYAALWLEDSMLFKPRGRWRLIQELKQKGITSDTIDEVLPKLLPEEKEIYLLRKLLLQRLSKIQDQPKDREKLVRFLLRRGFNYGQIINVAEELGFDLLQK